MKTGGLLPSWNQKGATQSQQRHATWESNERGLQHAKDYTTAILKDHNFKRGWFRGTPFRSPLQGGLKGLGARGGGGDEGLKVEGGFTFGRLQGGFKGASRGLLLEGGFKGA